MKNISEKWLLLFSFGIASGLTFLGVFVLPRINWGKLVFANQTTVTVTGEARKDVNNQIASFSAGVMVVNDNKESAVADVNRRIKAIIDAAKTFGVPDGDIKTENLNVYQNEETYYDNGVQKFRPGQWRVNNTITIKLRDIKRASDLADLLTKSGANNVYGPNFVADDTRVAENSLLGEAIADARTKAGIIARTSGRDIGKVINVVEGSAGAPIGFRMMGSGGGGPALEPGSQTISKTVTVTFELE